MADDDLRVLTPLRGLAALAVLLCHGYGGQWVPRGWLAVDLFFMLSGFVLTHAYPGLTRAAYPGFLYARLARVYPIHLLVLVLLLPFFGTSARFQTNGLIASLLLLQGPWGFANSWNTLAWSICAEWHAYLLFPLLSRLCRDRSPAALLAILVACTALVGLSEAMIGNLNICYSPLVLLRCLPEFVAGIALYRLLSRRGFAVPVPDWLIAVAIALLVGTAALGLPETATVVILGAILVGAVGNRGGCRRVLLSRPLVYLGDISYSVYMMQVVALAAVAPLPAALHPTAFVAADLLIAAVASRCVEFPARAFLRRLGGYRPAAAPGYGRAS